MTPTPEEMQRELDRLLCRMRALHPPPPVPPSQPGLSRDPDALEELEKEPQVA